MGDRCMDHIFNQEILKGDDSFVLNGLNSASDLFNKGLSFQPLQIEELGISIKCENYLNSIIKDDYIQRKKEDLKRVKTKLFDFNEKGNRNARMNSEGGQQIENTGNIKISMSRKNGA